MESFGVRISFRLPDGCSVLQAEISAIKKAAKWLAYYRIRSEDIRIVTDSQAAIRSLTGVYTTSGLVRECQSSLNEVAEHSNLTLLWVRGHCDNPGNIVADGLAREGADRRAEDIDQFCGLPLSACWGRIDGALVAIAQERWSSEPTCSIARTLWPRIDQRRTNILTRFARTRLRNLVAVITGHCAMGNHARRLGLPYNDYCRSCQDAEEEETIDHFLCRCPALEELRLRHMDRNSFGSLTELSSLELGAMDSFIRDSRWLYTGDA